MPPMQQPQRSNQPQQGPPGKGAQCPVCLGDPTRGRKKGQAPCPACHGGVDESPVGKAGAKQAVDARAAKVKQAVAQRQQAGAQGMRTGMQRPGPGMPPGGMGRPGGGAPAGQGQPQINPQVLAQLIARARGGR